MTKNTALSKAKREDCSNYEICLSLGVIDDCSYQDEKQKKTNKYYLSRKALQIKQSKNQLAFFDFLFILLHHVQSSQLSQSKRAQTTLLINEKSHY